MSDVDLDRAMSDAITICRRQGTLAVDIPKRGAKGSRHRLLDSTGTEAKGKVNASKDDGSEPRVRRRIDSDIDGRILETMAFESSMVRATGPSEPVGGRSTGDAPMSPRLLDQTLHDQAIGRGRRTEQNCPAMEATTAGAIAGNDALRASGYLGLGLCRNWRGYHRRRRAETRMHCVKLLGRRSVVRNFYRQVAEVQRRMAIPNGHTALAISVTMAAG